jgi:hypothetical protein
MLFSGRDIWRNGAFAHGGFMFAPGGFEQDGLLLKILFSSGLYRYVILHAPPMAGAYSTRCWVASTSVRRFNILVRMAIAICAWAPM